MPLTASRITVASRVMVRVYPLFALGVGLSFTLTPRGRLMASPSLRFMDSVAPLFTWGLGFLILAAWLALAWVTHYRRAYELGLALMVLWMGLYAAVNLLAAFRGLASFSAWTWPAFVACAAWSSALSLQVRET